MLPTHRPSTHSGEMLLKEFLEPLVVSQVQLFSAYLHLPARRIVRTISSRDRAHPVRGKG
jgi:antitoxin HigA-1